jgi:c-di-GMP-binding flagellar brake protein YcgR
MICNCDNLTSIIKMTIAELIKQATSDKPGNRKHPRLSLRLPMEYFLPGSPRQRLAYMHDICEGGLLVHTPEKLEIGQNLRVKFYHVSGSAVESIQTPGEVVRVDRLEKSGKEYRSAVKFVDLPPNVLKDLQKFLKSLY